MVIFHSYVKLPEGRMFNNRNVSHYSAMTLLPLTPVAVLQQLPAMWAEAPPLFPDHRLMPLFKHVENMLPFERSKCARLQSKAPKWIEWPACAC